MIKTVAKKIILFIDKIFKIRKTFFSESRVHPLEGDRAIEWSWVVKYLPSQPSKILDIGSVGSPLSFIASRFGHQVTSVDLRDIEYNYKYIKFIKKNVLDINFDTEKFDTIILCSMIEHVGLPERYGSKFETDGDLKLMQRLTTIMHKSSKIILTIPVGIDDVFLPYHRIYGEVRLPQLLKLYKIESEEYWKKTSDNLWNECSKADALNTKGSEEFYSLGLFVLSTKLD